MALTAGTKLGGYEILSAIGAGGMGEVYRARDSKLKREVAIKILPDEFNRDHDRVSRFQREAEVLASLNHPNIAAIHDLQEAAGSRFLVLELVEGETLAERVARGPLPVDEALNIAKQICEALEAAHEKGIVHRDLKPANIKITPDGKVKVLDFGLAKAFQEQQQTDLFNSPTMMTASSVPGVILGTAAYMSPEQAKGRTVDKRTDIFAFGTVLFEMLSGKPAFDGEDIIEIIAHVVTHQPNWSRLPGNVPPRIHELLQLCLEKNEKNRRSDATDVRLDIERALNEAENTELRAAPVITRSVRLQWIAAAIILPLVGAAVIARYLDRSSEKPAMVVFDIQPPGKGIFMGGTYPTLAMNAGAISPDGRTLAFTSQDSSGTTLLWLRPIASPAAHPMSTTDGAAAPFWSPDSRSVGFFAHGTVKTIDASGGAPRTIVDSAIVRGGTWGSDGVIVFSRGSSLPLYKVSSAGGQPSVATKLPGVFPSFLPDGHHFIFLNPADTGIYIGSVDSPESKHLGLTADSARYAPPGYLLFVQQGSLIAQAFDAVKLELSGSPIRLVDSIPAEQNATAYSVSNNGVLSYRAGLGVDRLQLAWFDRTGTLLKMVGGLGNYAGVDLSPDGRRVALHRHEGTGGGDIWLMDLSRGSDGPMTRLTFNASQENSGPVWSPDGGHIAFASLRNGKWGLYQKAVDGGGDEDLLFESDLIKFPWSWSPDGKSIVFGTVDPKTDRDTWLLPMTGERKPVPILNSPYVEGWGQVSPNGKWLSYTSDETFRREVYVRAFPSGEDKVQVSTNGGTYPRWRADGKELFFEQTFGGKLMAVPVKSDGATFQTGAIQELFDTRQSWSQPPGHAGNFHVYVVSPDGQRFLLPRPAADLEGVATFTSITVIVNWTELVNSKK